MYVSGEVQVTNGVFFILEGFQYNLVKHNELPNGGVRVSKS